MHLVRLVKVTLAAVCLSVGCSSEPAQESASALGTSEPMSIEECTQRNGIVVGDPGDGRTHQEDYRCADGSVPLGAVYFGIEGGVCCPR